MADFSLDQIKQYSKDEKIQYLKQLKNNLIGQYEAKEYYFDQGLIEKLLPMISDDQDPLLLQEIITIINSYFYDFPRVLDCFIIYKQYLLQIHTMLIKFQNHYKLIDIILRLINNLLELGVITPDQYLNQDLIQSLKPLLINYQRILLIAKIIQLLCKNEQFQVELSQNQDILDIFIDQITINQLNVSDELIENCLGALAQSTKNNHENVTYILQKNQKILKQLSGLLRHPISTIKIESGKLITNLNKHQKLNEEFQIQFRWLLMQMIQILPDFAQNNYQNMYRIKEICDIISSVAINAKECKVIQKIAGDMEVIDKICDILLVQKIKNKEEDPIDNNILNIEHMNNELIQSLFHTLACLTSQEETCRKKLIEKKSFLETLLESIKCKNRNIQIQALECFVSLSRSDQMIKAIIMDNEKFQTELQKLLINSDEDEQLQLNVCKCICNFASDNQKKFIQDEHLIQKIIQLTDTEIQNRDIRKAAVFAIKNLLYKCSKDLKKQLMKELTYPRLLDLLDDQQPDIQEQALMTFRNLLFETTEDIQTVLDEGKEIFLKKIEKKLQSQETNILVQTLYILSSIAGGNAKQKKVAIEERFFLQSLSILKSTQSPKVKIAVMNLILNLIWKENENSSDSKIRKEILEMNLEDMIADMRESETDQEVKNYYTKVINQLT